jgi:hypothetical protein
MCEDSSALHLKITAWHQNNMLSGVGPGFPKMEDGKSILMPRKHLLKTIDPLGTKLVREVLAVLSPIKSEYNAILDKHRVTDQEWMLIRHSTCTSHSITFHGWTHGERFRGHARLTMATRIWVLAFFAFLDTATGFSPICFQGMKLSHFKVRFYESRSWFG